MTKEKNELIVFKNEELGLQARTITNEDGSISISAEDTAFGFGWTEAKDGRRYVMWRRINQHCKELGFSAKVSKGDYIPESLFYLLGMKANNEIALKYQKWLAIEVIPQIRRTGGYIPVKEEDDDKTIMAKALQISQRTLEEKDNIIKQKDLLIQEQSKSVAFVKLVNETNGTKSMKEFADMLGIVGLGRNTLYELLREMEIILWNDTIPYRKYIDQGYLTVNESIARNGELVCSTRITPKGQVWLTKKILKHLDKTKTSVSDTARDYAKSMIVDVQHRSEEELNAMCIHPQLFRDEWEGVASFARELKDNVTYLEIQELLSEI